MKSFSETLQEINNELEGIANPYDKLYKSGEDRSRFPESLLDAGKDERLSYFRDKVILHDRLRTMTDEILTFIANPTRPIVLVIGPPNIGKTTLLYKVNRAFLMKYIIQMNEDPGLMPIGWGEALNSSKRIYQWNVFYAMGYKMLNEGLSGNNLLDGPDKYKRGFIGALNNRHTEVYQIDEGHNFIYISDTRGQMEEIKTISNLSNTTIIIYGTYDLIKFLDLNSQLMLRTEIFHFQRYLAHAQNAADFANFANIVGNFQNFLPVRKPPNFLDRLDYFYFHTAGCTGILKRWYMSSLSYAIENDKDTIDEECLRKYELSASTLMRLVREINDGEEYLLKMHKWEKGVEEKIRTRLGMDMSDPKDKPGGKGAAKEEVPPKKKKKQKVGKRKPVRDPLVPKNL